MPRFLAASAYGTSLRMGEAGIRIPLSEIDGIGRDLNGFNSKIGGAKLANFNQHNRKSYLYNFDLKIKNPGQKFDRDSIS